MMKKRYLSLLLALISLFTLALAAVPAAAVDADAAVPMETAPAEPVTTDDAAQPDASETPQPDASDSPAPATESPEPEESAKPEASAKPTDSPKPEESAKPSDSPKPEESAKPTASPKPEESPKPDPNAPWYQAAMDYAVKAGLLEGDEKGQLNPEKNATRAETVTILMRIFRNTQTKSITHYADVNTKDWFYKAMATAAAMNVVNGYDDCTMRPNAAVTRQEAFALISRVFAVAKGNKASLDRFPDHASVADWAVTTLAGMAEQKYMEGDQVGIRPNDSITRAELAQVLYNLKITMTSDPTQIPKDGIVVYHGKQPVDLTGFQGKLFFSADCGKAVTVTGNAPGAALFVRTDPGATVTLNGTVKETHLMSANTTLNGSGNAGSVERAAVDCTVNCAKKAVSNTYDSGLKGVKLSVSGSPKLTPENREVKFKVIADGRGCDYSTKPEGRFATLQWTENGRAAGSQRVWLGSKPTEVEITVSEAVWTPELSGKHDFRFKLLYETDIAETSNSVPIQNYSAEEYKQLQSRAEPYRIEVVKNQCTVMVWGQDKAGNFNILYRVCPCSPGQATPLGTFKTPSKTRWGALMGGVMGQYCTQIYKGILFHSVYYRRSDPSTLYADAYNQLGTICSHGCVRLTVADAKWIFDNCRLGTSVYIHNSDWMPVAKPAAQKIPYSGVLSGWDPTDPDPNNPWKNQ